MKEKWFCIVLFMILSIQSIISQNCHEQDVIQCLPLVQQSLCSLNYSSDPISCTENYGNNYITAPDFEIDFSILSNPNTPINTTTNAYTSNFNNTNNYFSDPLTFLESQESPMSILSIAIQMHELYLREEYTLQLLLSDFNLTFTPLNYSGQPVLNGKILTYNDISPFVIYQPQYQISKYCIICPRIPVCNNLPGCDGFSINMIDLLNLSPAQGYAAELYYSIKLPTISKQFPNRRLLATISGNNAVSSAQTVLINTSWFSLGSSELNTSNTITTAIFVVICFACVIIGFIVLALCCIFIKKRPRKVDNPFPIY